MNILIFGNGTLFVGQQERKLCVEFAKKGHKTFLVYDEKKIAYDVGELPTHENLVLIDIPMQNYRHTSLGILEKIDVVLGMDQSVSPIVAEYQRVYNVPAYCIFLDFPMHVIDGRDSVNYNFQYAQRYYYWINCALEITGIIFTNNFTVEQFKKIYHKDSYSVKYAISDDNFLDNYTPNKGDYIVSCNRIVPFKGTIYLVDALKRLEYKYKLITAAGINLEEFLKGVKQTLGDKVEIVFKPGDYDKMRIMADGYIFVYPQVTEWIGGLVPIEAMSVNTPCVCFDYPISRELYEDTVLYAKPKSVFDLRNKINELYNDKDLYKSLQQKGYELFKKYYTREKMVESLLTTMGI